ncbi:MAG: putative hydrolase [Actinomycetia bacterium]|nr:putative hydrolase [Actinomycetes bacterium]
MTLTGPDVSRYQGDVDMTAVKQAGHSFVGIKTTEGAGVLDPLFGQNRNRARTAGLIRLLYHFGRPSSVGTPADARAEADWFVDHIGNIEPGEIAVLDIEDDHAHGDLSGWALTFLARVDERTGRAGGRPEDDAVLYTYAPYARAHLRAGQLGQRPLWLAAYTNNPTVPAPWQDWTFHQFTSSGTCPGINGRCDLNRFDGPLAALQAISGMHPAKPADLPIPAPTVTTFQEDTMDRHDMQLDIDADGHGWRDIDIPFGKVVSVLCNTANPTQGGYKPIPDIAVLDVGGKARIVIEEAIPKGRIGVTVWAAA